MIEAVLEFWFTDQPQVALWFRATPDHDWQIYRRFHRLQEQALAGQLEDWAQTARGRLALILLLDQFPRHLFRHTAWAYRGDAQALHHCRQALQAGQDRQLEPFERLFLCAPLEHCEDLAVQQQAVNHIEGLLAQAPQLEYFARWIRIHHDVIAHFGRFPWRNRALGRPNTPEESAYLSNNPPYLGQW